MPYRAMIDKDGNEVLSAKRVEDYFSSTAVSAVGTSAYGDLLAEANQENSEPWAQAVLAADQQNQLTYQLDMTSVELGQVRSLLDNLNNEKEARGKNIVTKLADIESLERQLTSQQDTLKDHESELALVIESKEKLNEKLRENNLEIEKRQTLIDDLVSESQKISQQIMDMREQCKVIENDLANKQAALEALEGKSSSAEELGEAEPESKVASPENLEIAKAKEDIEAQILLLEQMLQDLTQEEKLLKEKEEKIEALHLELAPFEESNAEIDKKILPELSEKRDLLIKQVEEQKSVCGDMEMELTSRKEKEKQSQEEMRALEEQISSLKARESAFNATTEQTRKELVEAIILAHRATEAAAAARQPLPEPPPKPKPDPTPKPDSEPLSFTAEPAVAPPSDKKISKEKFEVPFLTKLKEIGIKGAKVECKDLTDVNEGYCVKNSKDQVILECTKEAEGKHRYTCPSDDVSIKAEQKASMMLEAMKAQGYDLTRTKLTINSGKPEEVEALKKAASKCGVPQNLIVDTRSPKASHSADAAPTPESTKKGPGNGGASSSTGGPDAAASSLFGRPGPASAHSSSGEGPTMSRTPGLGFGGGDDD